MSSREARIEELMIAALDVISSVSEENLASGRTATVTVPRTYIKALERAANALNPGVVARLRSIQKMRKTL